MRNHPWSFLFLGLLLACGEADPVDPHDEVPNEEEEEEKKSDEEEEEEEEEEEGPLEIMGTWTDPWGTAHLIDDSSWIQSFDGEPFGTFHILDYSNQNGWLITHNDESNEWYPEHYSRFDWFWDEDDLYYCQTTFASETEEEAREALPADATDLETGCAGASWTALIP